MLAVSRTKWNSRLGVPLRVRREVLDLGVLGGAVRLYYHVAEASSAMTKLLEHFTTMSVHGFCIDRIADIGDRQDYFLADFSYYVLPV